MEKIFSHVVSLSLAGSFFLLAVMLLRQILRKAPKWIFCLLWGVAALYLILPVTVKTDFSLVHENVVNGELVAMVADGYVGDVEYIYEDSPGYEQAVHAGRVPFTTREGTYVITQKGSFEEPERVKDLWLPAISWVWFAGIAVMLGFAFISYLKLRKKVSTATLCGINMKESEYVDSPFVLGLFRPVIYLPYNLASQDREYVIIHEQAHIRRKDHWWKPIGYLLLAVYWFNPIMWAAYILLCRDIEAACDEKVIRNMDAVGIRAYSTALLNCSIHRRTIAACPLAFGEVGVKERIKRVMHYKKPAFWIVLLAVIGSIAAAALFLTTREDSAQPQIQQTQPTEPSAPAAHEEQILALLNKIANNKTVAASSNPYDYINAEYQAYAQILLYGDTARDYLMTALRESQENGLREYIMAAACAELTGFGLNKSETPWASGKEWLALFDQAQDREPLGTEEDTVGGLLGVDSLLGIDCAVMRIVAVEDHPTRPGVHRYSYRFQYYGDGTSYDWDGQEWYLVEIHSCLDIKMGDFDYDGVVELFYYTDTQEYPYYICDRVGDTLVEQGYTLVPDAVLDYDILLNRDIYYLYNERWNWFLNDPVTYVQEVAKLPRERLFRSTPNGIIPEGTDQALVEKAYKDLQNYLEEARPVYEKQVVYRIMTVMEYTYTPELVPGEIDYRELLEKWGFTQSMSTEEKNCYAQILTAFDADPEGFIRGMAQWEDYHWAKDMYLVAGELSFVNFLYDAQGYRELLYRLEDTAQTEKERELVHMLMDCLEDREVPALDAKKLAACSGDELWKAFYYAPDRVLESLAQIHEATEESNATHILPRLWSCNDYFCYDPKLMEKGYQAIDRLLSGNPTQAEKDAAYPFLLCMELFGDDLDVYVPGEPFDYERLFDKLTYADGAFTENCMSQAAIVYTEDPAEFIRHLTAWVQTDRQEKITEIMALSFAHRYQSSETYLKVLYGLLDGMPEAKQKDMVKLFIDAYQKVRQENA